MMFSFFRRKQKRIEELDGYLYSKFGEHLNQYPQRKDQETIVYLAEDYYGASRILMGTMVDGVKTSIKKNKLEQTEWIDSQRYVIKAGSPLKSAGNYFPAKYALYEVWRGGWAGGSSLDCGGGVSMAAKVVANIDELTTEKARKLARGVMLEINKVKQVTKL